MAGLDIFAAKEEENGKYLVTNLGAPLNSKYDDFGFIMDTDSLKGYFTSNRPGGAGDDDIYSFSVTAIDLSVKSLRADNREILPNSKIYLISEKGDPITSGQSDQDGKVDFGIKPGAKYKISAENGSMIADVQDVDASSQLIGLQETQEILLKQGYPYLTIEVLDKETGLIIPNALVDISEGDYDHSTLEDNNGIVRMKMNNSTNYTFYTTADEYFSSTVKYSSIDKTPGNYSLTIELEKLSTGKQIALEDLFYDLNKWNIRPDAALVLDKLAQILTQNPDVRIEIGSHTDSRGSAESNMTLSQHRSESVMAYLIKKGIAPSRLVAKGYGESQLVNKCADGVICTEEEHQENRRTVIEILNKDIRKVKRGNRNVYYF
jgi:outer membrane protein OmpA-like peptidoglycan-associated protein